MVFNVQKENQMIPLENEDVVAYKIKSALRSTRPGYLVLDKQLSKALLDYLQKTLLTSYLFRFVNLFSVEKA